MAIPDEGFVELGPISPELCLIDPELARAARARLAVDGDLEADVVEAVAAAETLPVLRAPDPRRRSPRRRPRPETRARPRRSAPRSLRRLPRVVIAGAALLAALPFLPAPDVRGAEPARSQSRGPISDSTTPARVLIVPDVCRLAYVFAKGRLQDAGFAWHVAGSLEGYAGYRVAQQAPAPGTVVVDTGAPTVTLTLTQNFGYVPRGKPDDNPPYTGTPLEIAASVGRRLADALTPAAAAPIMNRCEQGLLGEPTALPHGL